MTTAKQLGAGSGAAYLQPIQGQGPGQGPAACEDCCPEDRKDAASTPSKQVDFSGRTTGRVGLELVEQDRVEVTGVNLTANPSVSFGDPRIVSALSDINSCSATRGSTTLLEVPFEITKTGNVRIALDGFTEIVARAVNVQVDQGNFTATPQSPQ